MENENRTFKDINGDAWTLTLTAGKALRLRNELDFDIQKIIERDNETLKRLINDNWVLIEILAIMLAEQVERRQMTDAEFFERLTGPTLDGALKAFLNAAADMLPKLQRRPIQALIAKIFPTIEAAATRLEAKAEAMEMQTEVMEEIDKIFQDSGI